MTVTPMMKIVYWIYIDIRCDFLLKDAIREGKNKVSSK